jgi:hypothetical protein
MVSGVVPHSLLDQEVVGGELRHFACVIIHQVIDSSSDSLNMFQRITQRFNYFTCIYFVRTLKFYLKQKLDENIKDPFTPCPHPLPRQVASLRESIQTNYQGSEVDSERNLGQNFLCQSRILSEKKTRGVSLRDLRKT